MIIELKDDEWMKRILWMMIMGIFIVSESLSVSATESETFPDKISFLTIKAYNIEDENQRLANVLVEIFTEQGESLGVYETNQEGQILVEIIPGYYRIEIIESTEGFEALSESRTQVIDASGIDVYQVQLLHAPVEAVSTGRMIPTTGLKELLLPCALGFTIVASGLYLKTRKK